MGQEGSGCVFKWLPGYLSIPWYIMAYDFFSACNIC